MLEGACHCGAVRFTIPAAPESVTDCNCSICRRLGTLWAYYSPTQVMLNGEWTDAFGPLQVLDDEWLRQEQARLGEKVEGRWSTEAHVCASVIGFPTIFCVILPGIWN